MFHAFVVMSSHFFYVMKNLWTFFFSLFLLFDALVGHQALVKQNKGPRVRGGRAEHLRSTGLGVDGGGFTDLWMNEWRHTYMLWFVFPLFSQLNLCWKMNWKKMECHSLHFFPLVRPRTLLVLQSHVWWRDTWIGDSSGKRGWGY